MRLRSEALGVVAGSDEKCGGGVDSDAVDGEELGGGVTDERAEQRVQPVGLFAQVPGTLA